MNEGIKVAAGFYLRSFSPHLPPYCLFLIYFLAGDQRQVGRQNAMIMEQHLCEFLLKTRM